MSKVITIPTLIEQKQRLINTILDIKQDIKTEIDSSETDPENLNQLYQQLTIFEDNLAEVNTLLEAEKQRLKSLKVLNNYA